MAVEQDEYTVIAVLIIVFREIVEAGLIVGIVLAITEGIHGSRLWIFGGVFVGIIGSAILAAFTGVLARAFAGSGHALFNAAILAFAVAMLAWHNIWISRHGRRLATEMRATGEAVSTGREPLIALAVVVGVAVLREGAEVVLFLYGVVLSDELSLAALFAGGFLGVLAGSAVSALVYFGLIQIPARLLFGVIRTLIAFIAAGMAAEAVSFLEKAGLVTLLERPVWDTSAYLPEKSILGRVLLTLVGYRDAPSLLQLVVYLIVLVSILVMTRAMAPTRIASFKAA